MAVPLVLVVNPADETLWVSGWVNGDIQGGLTHLSLPDLSVLWQGTPNTVRHVAVNTSDNSCWASVLPANLDEPHQVIHVSDQGVELWRDSFGHVKALAVNSTDGSCWVAETSLVEESGAVIHLSAEGVELWRGELARPIDLSVNPTDGSCRVAEQGAGQVISLKEDGTELWRCSLPMEEYDGATLEVNPTDGSCWVAEGLVRDLVLLSSGGGLLWRWEFSDMGYGVLGPLGVGVDPWDGSCWVYIEGNGGPYSRVYHVQTDGRITEKVAGFSELFALTAWGRYASTISVNPRDGACWIADTRHGQLVRLNGSPSPFRDVSSDYWALAAIIACFRAGIVNGYPDYTYRPYLPVSRAAMAVFLSRALAGGESLVPTGPALATFPDVPTDHWAFRHVEYAADRGVVGGYEDGTYRPDVTVTREAMAVFVARSLAGGDGAVPAGPETASFPDVPTSHWAYKYVEYCKAQEVVGGYPDGTYRPLQTVTRDQMAVYVQRAFDLPM